jgi:hypothetical protein
MPPWEKNISSLLHAGKNFINFSVSQQIPPVYETQIFITGFHNSPSLALS